MKKNIKVLLLFLSIHSVVSSQVVDSVGYKIVAEQLTIIKNYLADPNSDTTLKRSVVINFLTDLTGIASESDGNFYGQLSPTKKDYLLWMTWLSSNKEYLYYDKNSGNVVIHRGVKPPKFIKIH